ncbi:pro-head protease [Escherichia coli]|nr:pro-head protease [Escherichia coli]
MSGFTSGDGCLLMMIPSQKRAHAHMKAGSLTGLSIGYVLKDWEYDRAKKPFC